MTYRLQDTLRVPWFNDFRLDAGYCVLLYEQPSGPAIVFDTQMNCHYRLGMIISRSDGPAVVFRPQSVGWDGLILIGLSEFSFNAIIGAGHVFPEGHPLPGTDEPAPKPGGRGIGLLLDAAAGPIDSNRISVIETAACEVGVAMYGATYNHFEFSMVYLCNTHVLIDERSHGNRIEVAVNSQGLEGSAGVVIAGYGNLVTLNTVQTAPQQNVVFEETAADNLIIAMRLPNGVTSRATMPTNRIIRGDPAGFDVPTPPVPKSGEVLVNTHPYVVEVIILSAGDVSG